MAEYELIKTTFIGGYKKEEVQELIQRLKDEKAELEADYKKQLAEKEARIAELQKRLELKDEYQFRLEDEIKEKYQRYIDNFDSIGKLVFEAQLKADSIEKEAREKCDKMLSEAEEEAKQKLESVQSEIDMKLVESENQYHILQEKMSGFEELIEQVQEKVITSCGEMKQIISGMPVLGSNQAEKIQKAEEEYTQEEDNNKEFVDDQEIDFLDAMEDMDELEEFDEEDDEEDEDSRLALQISKLLSEEDEAMLEEELEDL